MRASEDREERGYGIPRTDEQRRARHYDLYGTEELPPRGTGLSQSAEEDRNPFSFVGWSVLAGVGIALGFAFVKNITMDFFITSGILFYRF